MKERKREIERGTENTKEEKIENARQINSSRECFKPRITDLSEIP